MPFCETPFPRFHFTHNENNMMMNDENDVITEHPSTKEAKLRQVWMDGPAYICGVMGV